MKLARIQYPSGIKQKDKAILRKRFDQLAGNLKGNAKLEAIVKKPVTEIYPLNKKITVKIDSQHVTPCIKYANSEYAVITDLSIDVKIYYKPLNYCN